MKVLLWMSGYLLVANANYALQTGSKPGECPPDFSTQPDRCPASPSCQGLDMACPGKMKCCPYNGGCSFICVHPVGSVENDGAAVTHKDQITPQNSTMERPSAANPANSRRQTLIKLKKMLTSEDGSNMDGDAEAQYEKRNEAKGNTDEEDQDKDSDTTISSFDLHWGKSEYNPSDEETYMEDTADVLMAAHLIKSDHFPSHHAHCVSALEDEEDGHMRLRRCDMNENLQMFYVNDHPNQPGSFMITDGLRCVTWHGFKECLEDQRDAWYIQRLSRDPSKSLIMSATLKNTKKQCLTHVGHRMLLKPCFSHKRTSRHKLATQHWTIFPAFGEIKD